MNKKKPALTGLVLFFTLILYAQGDYIVKTTTSTATTAGTEEEQFVLNNFPNFTICELKEGQRFLLVVEDKYGFMPILKSTANDREVSNSKLQHKLLEFKGVDEVSKETYSGTNLSTRFMFESEGEKYYHEVKNRSLNDICANNPRAMIHNLVFLGDVDIARELLTGQTLYTKVAAAYVDDGSSSSGFREVKVPRNLEVTVTSVGAGNRECPVKIVFQDRDGNSYYRNVMFSKTNSGLSDRDMVGANRDKYFPNVFSFADKDVQNADDIRNKYVGRAIYPKRTIEVKKTGGALQSLPRYTPLTIKNINTEGPGTMASLTLADKKGNIYTVNVNLKYDVFIRNEDYIDDMFGYGDLRKQYPAITEENWLLLGQGEIKTGMTKNECRLSLGEPIQIVVSSTLKYESWYYRGRTLDFEGDRLIRIK